MRGGANTIMKKWKQEIIRMNSDWIITYTYMMAKPPHYTGNEEEDFKSAKIYLEHAIKWAELKTRYSEGYLQMVIDKFETKIHEPKFEKVQAYRVKQFGQKKEEIIFV